MNATGVSRCNDPEVARERSARQVTELLAAWNKGDRASMDLLFPLVYGELRRLAAGRLRRERHDHTLQVTGLVHEAYLRLLDQESVWECRSQFFAIASELMRRVLLDYAKQKQALKRGGGAVQFSIDDRLTPDLKIDENLLLIDQALTKLNAVDQCTAKIVEMRFFGGLTNEDIAEALRVSTATVQRRWSMAKAWLYHEISPRCQP
jgi:RNA polymerase sigma-70 factor, ECF subfamily